MRVSGKLSRGRRGLILTTDDSDLWVVEADEDVTRLVGQRVVVEGVTTGMYRLKADWIGTGE